MKHTYIALLAGAAVCLPATAQAAEILACSKYMENPPSSPPYGRPMDQRDMRDMRGQYEHPPQNRPWEADPAATGHSTYRPWPRLFPPAPNTQLVCAKDSSSPFYSTLSDLAAKGWNLKTAVSSPEAYTFYLERGGWGKEHHFYNHEHHEHMKGRDHDHDHVRDRDRDRDHDNQNQNQDHDKDRDSDR